jgi:predicted Fe-S protein YdhL (DUF1289 family)
MSQDTPCIAVCMIDPKTSLCFGCGRTLPEIARWGRMESAERRALMAQLPARMADAGLPQMAREEECPLSEDEPAACDAETSSRRHAPQQEP